MRFSKIGIKAHLEGGGGGMRLMHVEWGILGP